MLINQVYKFLESNIFRITLIYLNFQITQSVCHLVVSFERRLNEFNGISKPGDVLNCAAQCASIPDCTCVRLAANQSQLCEPLIGEKDANGLNHTNYVYYSMITPNSSEENFALKKPASQSSVYEVNGISYTADRAVDGNPNIETFALPYLAQTKDGDSFPWWQVDLRKDYLISRVKIMNRKNPADRLHDFEIRVGTKSITNEYANIHFTSNRLCNFYNGSNIEPGKLVTFECKPCPLAGRFITIQIVKFCEDCREKDKNILNLAEVEVYGSTLLVEKRSKNDSKGKKKQSDESDYEEY